MVRSLLNELVKETLLAITSINNVSVVVTTQGKTKLVDEFGERASFKDAKHSFIVPALCEYIVSHPLEITADSIRTDPFWQLPHSYQIILSAAPDGSRNAMMSITHNGNKGDIVRFVTTVSDNGDGIRDVCVSLTCNLGRPRA